MRRNLSRPHVDNRVRHLTAIPLEVDFFNLALSRKPSSVSQIVFRSHSAMLLLCESFSSQLIFFIYRLRILKVINPSYEYDYSKSDLRSEHYMHSFSKCSEPFSVPFSF